MKMIDILNKMASGKLKDGFKFKWNGYIYTFDKVFGFRDKNRDTLSEKAFIEYFLNDKVEVIEENKEIEEINENEFLGLDMYNKMNEIIRAVNKLYKEREEK